MKIDMRNLMRTFPFRLILTLPTTGAALGGSGSDTDVERDHRLAESFTETMNATSKPFPSPSYIFEGVQDDHLPPVLHTTRDVSMMPNASPSDFWEMAKKSEKTLQSYVHRLLEAAGEYFQSTRFTDITSVMNQIVNATSTFRNNIEGTLAARQVTFDIFTEELETLFMAIASELEKIPPPDKAPGHAERAEMVDKVLDDTKRELVKLAARYGIKEDVVTTYLSTLKQHVGMLIVAVGDINEQHSLLLPALTFSVATLLIPESWILGPFLRLFGFGPTGPVKGSVAAWSQRYFWGAAVQSGSWFSLLQAAGMGVLPVWAGFVTKISMLVGGAFATLFDRG